MGQLTLSGNEITDASRLAALSWGTTQIGGQTDGAGLIPGWKNLIANGDFEVDLSGWSPDLGATLTRDTTRSKYGMAAMKIVETGGNHAHTTFSVTNGLTYTASMWVFVPSGAPQLQIQVGAGTTYFSNPTVVNDMWTRVTLTFTATASLPSATFILHNNQGALSPGSTIWVDGVQVETGSIAHNFVSGTQPSTMTTPNGVYIGRTATNLFRQGQCDATIDYGKTSGNETIVLDNTTPAPFAPQSINVTVTSASIEGPTMISAGGQAATVGTVGVGSVWFKGISGNVYRAHIDWTNTDVTTTLSALMTFTATGDWQFVVPPSVAVAAGKTGDQLKIVVATDTARAESFWVAHPMLESGQSVVAPYVATSGGNTATHSAGRVQAPASLLDETHGWAAMRLRLGYSTATLPGNTYSGIFGWGDGNTGTNAIMLYRDTTNAWRIERTASLTGGTDLSARTLSQTWNTGDYATVVAAWSATSLSVSINGLPFTTIATTAANVPTIVAALFDIGGAHDENSALRWSDSAAFWFICGTGTLTDADAATLNALGNTDPVAATLGPAASTTMIWPAVDSTYHAVTVKSLTTTQPQSPKLLRTGGKVFHTSAVPTAARPNRTVGVNRLVSSATHSTIKKSIAFVILGSLDSIVTRTVLARGISWIFATTTVSAVGNVAKDAAKHRLSAEVTPVAAIAKDAGLVARATQATLAFFHTLFLPQHAAKVRTQDVEVSWQIGPPFV